MSEKITKSWIEKTIHEKAKQRFEDDVQDFFRTLNMTKFTQAPLNFSSERTDASFTIDDLNDYCDHADREGFMKMLFKDYDKLKSETINFYEQQITDRLLNDMSGLRKFLES